VRSSDRGSTAFSGPPDGLEARPTARLQLREQLAKGRLPRSGAAAWKHPFPPLPRPQSLAV